MTTITSTGHGRPKPDEPRGPPLVRPRGDEQSRALAMRRRAGFLLLALGAAGLLALALVGARVPDVLFLVPAFALVAPLVASRYVGERRLLALAAVNRSASSRPRTRALWQSRPRAHLPRGGLLIAFSLAVRPPPVLLASI